MYMGANGFYWVINYDPESQDVDEVRKGHGSNAWRARPGEFHLSFTGEYGTLWRHRGRATTRRGRLRLGRLRRLLVLPARSPTASTRA